MFEALFVIGLILGLALLIPTRSEFDQRPDAFAKSENRDQQPRHQFCC